MKKISLIIFAFAIIQISFGQNIAPQGTASNVADWTRGGNTGGTGSANIIGPSHYMPFYFRVGGTNLTTDIRMKMNPTFATADQYGINGFTRTTGVNTNGYVGIGVNNTMNTWTTDRLWSNLGPFSMLHLNGNGSFVQELGYRPWMQTGITFTSNSDMAYIGHRATDGVEDRTDLMLVWSDNGIGASQDNLIFAFTTGDATGMGSNDLDGTANYGREIMRMIPDGNIGIGPRFNNSNNPKSQLHIHGNDNTATWMQITNQFVSTATNNVTANDGFRFGINSTGQVNFIQNENQPTIFYNAYNSTPGVNYESVRIIATTNGGMMGVGGRTGNLYYGNSANPTQTLEVNSSTAGYSGLRFTKLNSSTTPLATNPGNGFLAVNAQGDVIYVQSPTTSTMQANNGCSISNNNVVLGNNVGSALSQLTNNREIPMNNQSILFTQTGRIGIGNVFTGGLALPNAKLDIYADVNNVLAQHVRSDLTFTSGDYIMAQYKNMSFNAGTNTAVDVHTGGSSIKRGIGINILVNCATSANDAENIGIISKAENSSRYNTGGGFYSSGNVAVANTGIGGYARQSVGTNFGGVFRGGDADQYTGGYNGNMNVGVWAEGFGGIDCYGIYATATGGSSTNYAAFFAGDVWCTGNYGGSDSLIKENVNSFNNALGLINQLNPKTFTFKTTQYPQMHLPSGNQYGLIAQDVEQVLPEFVKSITQPAVIDSAGNIISPSISIKGVKYESFIPILIQAVQEINTKNDSAVLVLNHRVDSLENVISTFENRFNELSERIEECCKNGNGNGHGNGHGNNKSNGNNNGDNESNSTINTNLTEITLENSETIILEQNVPNPFAESTTINYYIPENINYAQVVFSNNFGKIIKTVDITTSGKGTIKVFASNLSSGTYSYSLIVDGKIVESKKMVCVK